MSSARAHQMDETGPVGPGRRAGRLSERGDGASGRSTTTFGGGPRLGTVAGPAALALRRVARRPEVALVVRLVAEALGIAPALLFHSSRCKAEIAAARQLAMYLMNVDLGLSFTEIGALFGRDRTTVRHACARIEDRRDQPDEPDFESRVSALEAAIATAMEQEEVRRAAL